MHNDTIKVANKIISDNDLRDIFQKMDDEIKRNQQICRQETMENEKYETEYQHWTTKDFEGMFKCEINFYDDTNVTFDNYLNFITIFNNRLHEIKNMYLRYGYQYSIRNGYESKYVSKSIAMNIYEYKMDIDVNMSSDDDKMDAVYQLIKEKILNAPPRYSRVVKKKTSITSKIQFAVGAIPALVLCSLLALVPTVRYLYAQTYVLYPIVVLVLSFFIGGVVYGGRLDRLYSSIVPEKVYDHYDVNAGKSVYKDDMDKYLTTSEILIGKNVDNISNRKEIVQLEKKFSKFIPAELIALTILSIIMILIGNL